MEIPTLEHVIEAIQTAVRKYPGGVRAMAAEMDMAPSSLGNVLNPYADREKAKLGLEQTAFIMRKTGDMSPLQLLAAEFGFSLLPLDATPDHDLAGEQLDDIQKLARYQDAIRSRLPRKDRVALLGDLIMDITETEAAACIEDGHVYRHGKGFVKVSEERQ